MSYERTVSAALAETKSKFALAEALALDIPPRPMGPTPEGERSLNELLAEARQAIIDAGGEPKVTATLDHYRRTALWVSEDVSKDFQWVGGFSYSAHDQARMSGLKYEAFASQPMTVREIRELSGTASPDGGNVAKSWAPERKAEIARELLSDPAVAEQVSEQITDYVAESPERTSEAVRKRHDNAGVPQRQPKQEKRDYDDMIDRAVNLLSVALAAESSGRWVPSEHSEAMLYFLTQVLGERRQPTGEEAEMVNEKLESLFTEVEAYANSEAS